MPKRLRAVATSSAVAIVLEHENTVELRLLDDAGRMIEGAPNLTFYGRAPNVAWNGWRIGMAFLPPERERIEFYAIDPIEGIVRRDRYFAVLTARDEPIDFAGTDDGTFHAAWHLDESKGGLVYQHVSPDGHPIGQIVKIPRFFQPIAETPRGPIVDATSLSVDRHLIMAVVLGTPLGPIEPPIGAALEPIMLRGRWQFAWNGTEAGVVVVTDEIPRTDDIPDEIVPERAARFLTFTEGVPTGVVRLDQPTFDIALANHGPAFGTVVRAVAGENKGKLVFDHMNSAGFNDAAPECVDETSTEGDITLLGTRSGYIAIVTEREGDQTKLVAISGFGCSR